MTRRTLVAGLGDVRRGDDGFGVAVARLLAEGPPLPRGVTVADYGIAGTHLAFDAAAGVDELVLVEALPPRALDDEQAVPGEIRLWELPAPAAAPTCAAPGDDLGEDAAAEPAGTTRRDRPRGGEVPTMTPVQVLRLLTLLGGGPTRVRLVGCVTAERTDTTGLSPPVAAAVAPAAALVRAVVSGGTQAPSRRLPDGEETGLSSSVLAVTTPARPLRAPGGGLLAVPEAPVLSAWSTRPPRAWQGTRGPTGRRNRP